MRRCSQTAARAERQCHEHSTAQRHFGRDRNTISPSRMWVLARRLSHSAGTRTASRTLLHCSWLGSCAHQPLSSIVAPLQTRYVSMRSHLITKPLHDPSACRMMLQ